MKALPYQFDLAAIFRFRDQYQVTHLQRNQNQLIIYQILHLKIFKINYLSRLFINKKGVLSNLGHFFHYRTGAIKGRSQLVAAPLSFQAKNRFLCAFYVAI